MTTEKQGTLNMGAQQSTPPDQVPEQEKVSTPPPIKPKEEKTPPAIPDQLKDLAMCFVKPKQAFLSAGGTDQQFAREVNFAMQAMLNTPYLIECARQYPDHLIEAIKNVSLTGLTLNPELRLAYLVPYKGKVKFQSSYMGKREILLQSGIVKDFEAVLVYANDKFTFRKGVNATLEHEPDVFATKEDRGELKGGYYTAMLANGVFKYDVMPASRIDEIKSRSEAVKAGKSSPWNTDFEEMAKKTILNWAFKSLPKTGISDKMINVLEIINDVENSEFEEWRKMHGGKSDGFDEDEPIYPEEVK